MSGLTLGGVTLEGFEIPGGLRFGGRQALAVHKLPGGARVIDALGPDDSDLSWSGVMTGSAAADRARALDLMRCSGATIPLAWNAFYYRVVVRRLEMSFCNPWWIPYVIACAVVSDPVQVAVPPALTDASAIFSDLSAVIGFSDITSVIASIGQAGAMTPGTSAYSAAGAALALAGQQVDVQIASAESAAQNSDLIGIVSAAGSMAVLTSDQGYLRRAAANFGLASL